MGCLVAGKALHFREVSPLAEAQAKSHRPSLHLPAAQSTVQSRYICTRPWDVIC